jgi:DMSO/TMAO reductase YedYZ molybdopterin-dependent catalytic subunit
VDAVAARQAPNVHKAIARHGAWSGVPAVDGLENRDETRHGKLVGIEGPDGNESERQ